MPSVHALVVAAGQGSRFGGPLPKQYLPLAGATVLRHAVSALTGHPRIAEVLVVIRPEDRARFEQAVAGLAVLPPVGGGATRQDSVRLGLEALAPHCPDRVLIHDGARPFPDQALVDRIIDGLDRASASLLRGRLSNTIRRRGTGAIGET